MKSPSTPPAITVENVTKNYDGSSALGGITLNVARGEFFGMIGPNGAGKTTLIELMAGLQSPTSGRIRVLGFDPAVRDKKFLLSVGMQTQHPAFFDALSVREHLEVVAGLRRASRRDVEDAMELVDLQDVAKKRIDKLSGGQKQRVSIAATVLHRPQIIFLDEPTAALDPEVRRQLWVTLERLRTAGTTTIYTTHYLNEAERLCDRVAILDAGEIVTVGSPAELCATHSSGTQIITAPGRLTRQEAEQLPDVHLVEEREGSLVLHTARPGAVMAIVEESGGLAGVTARHATLEDVYFKLTGKEMSHES
ncbi:ABC transporter ATP-binding protein [Curtobacterium sp. S6]|uniref:ABC transporter ATP-binding protein n=2 Tax=Micrococcales TaxID=85006 RepID=UPI0004A9F80E|nr:ABC transporter ATP-binding protein [Curtobacterium sp. S6]